MLGNTKLVSPALLLLAATGASAQLANSVTAFTTLQTWYNDTTGLWNTAGWWNAANSLTVVAELAAADPSILDEAVSVFETTFNVAPSANPSDGLEKRVGSNGDIVTIYPAGWPYTLLNKRASTDPTDPSSWLDGANDDAQWWALAWVAAYDVTGNDTYLALAKGLFSDIVSLVVIICWFSGVYKSRLTSLSHPRLGEQLGNILWRWWSLLGNHK
jgi:hypothetical protein